MSKRQNLLAVWQQIPLANRTVVASTVSDKTGYTLTAGSYSVRASAVQTAILAVTGASSNTSAISSVTTTRTVLGFLGFLADSTSGNFAVSSPRITLTNATTVTGNKETATNKTELSFVVLELF